MRYFSRALALSLLFWADMGIFAGIADRSITLWHVSLYAAIACLITLGIETIRLGT
jgi:hypothetical protein